MNKLLIAFAAAGLSAMAATPVLSQNSAQPSPPASQTTPTYQQQTPATSGDTSQAQDLTGQTIYSSDGHAIGVVASMGNNAGGNPVAVVGVQQYLGMGGKNVEFPVSSLSQRAQGGYATSLTSDQIKKLPAVPSGTD